MAAALANRYARALADVVTAPGSEVTAEEAVAQLGAFAALLESSSELRRVLTSPTVPPARKKALLARLGSRLGVARTTQNFLYVVSDHRRLGLLGQMREALEKLLDERMGVARAAIASAQPIEAVHQAALAGKLSRLTGKQARLEFAVDPALLGGVVARIGSTIYDGSVRGRLRALGRRLATE
jgi:F-type H+-transporting ATPase subunit delta